MQGKSEGRLVIVRTRPSISNPRKQSGRKGVREARSRQNLVHCKIMSTQCCVHSRLDTRRYGPHSIYCALQCTHRQGNNTPVSGVRAGLQKAPCGRPQEAQVRYRHVWSNSEPLVLDTDVHAICCTLRHLFSSASCPVLPPSDALSAAKVGRRAVAASRRLPGPRLRPQTGIIHAPQAPKPALYRARPQ